MFVFYLKHYYYFKKTVTVADLYYRVINNSICFVAAYPLPHDSVPAESHDGQEEPV